MPFYAFGHLCITYCPSKYFKTLQSVRATKRFAIPRTVRVCAPCHHSCYTCTGPTDKNCTACPLFSLHHEQMHSCSQPLYPRMDLGATKSSIGFSFDILLVIIFGGVILLLCLVSSLFWMLRKIQVYRFSFPMTPRTHGLEMCNLQSDGEEAAVAQRHILKTSSIKIKEDLNLQVPWASSMKCNVCVYVYITNSTVISICKGNYTLLKPIPGKQKKKLHYVAKIKTPAFMHLNFNDIPLFICRV